MGIIEELCGKLKRGFFGGWGRGKPVDCAGWGPE